MTIRGNVHNHEAFVRITIAGNNGEMTHLEALLDTGFNGALILPAHTIEQLGLTALSVETLILADGGELACKVYSLNALWHEETRRVSVHEMGDKPLAGMRLLTGSRVTLDVVDGGPVTIEPLTAQ